MDESQLIPIFQQVAPIVVRIAAFVLTLPVVATRVVPLRIKLALIIALSLLVVPGAVKGPSAADTTSPTLELGITLFNEAMIGALMGVSLSLILAGVQLVGSLIEGLCGFSMASIGATAADDGTGPIARLFWWTTAAVFVASGGMERVVDGLLSSFVLLPCGAGTFDQSFVDMLTRSVGQAFAFGLQAAFPAIAALLVASVVTGMAQRNFPQLGGMNSGFSIKAVFGMVVTSAVLLTAPWVIDSGLSMALEELHDWMNLLAVGQGP